MCIPGEVGDVKSELKIFKASIVEAQLRAVVRKPLVPVVAALFQVNGKKAYTDCRTSDSGGTMRIPSWLWSSRPTFYPRSLAGWNLPNLSTCVL